MNNIIRLEKLSEYNAIKKAETLHPLVTIIGDSNRIPMPNGKYHFGFYAVFLKDVKCGEISYGRNKYDYEEGTLVFISPGQVIGVKHDENYLPPKGFTLLFHPDLLHGTLLGRKIKQYTFFSYELNEALHVSEKERMIIIDLLDKISYELAQSIDKHTKDLITSTIELLLNYCVRFYDRQFITRNNINIDILNRFEVLLNEYFHSELPQILGLPTVKYCADQLNISANYFGDLLKKETGKSPQEFLQLKLIHVAKERIFDTSKTISEIAYELGFKYPQHFSRMFKNETGLTPNEYRSMN